MALGEKNLRLTYTDDELRTAVATLIESTPDGVGFRDICSGVLSEAMDQGRVAGGTKRQYQWMQLAREDIVRIDRVLWDFILAREILIDFDTTRRPVDDHYFIKA